ncbi:MAG: CHASE domain-containing protein [Thalassotalea sp.]|nr:CHASE domain-containing protein [Thalassotalea sp.]
MRKYKNYWVIFWIFLLGIGFSLVVYITLQKWEKIDHQLAFQSQAQSTVHSIENEFNDFTNALYSFGDFFQLSENVSREQFAQYSQSHLARYPSILLFSWNPMVLSADRENFSAQMANEGFSGVEIRKVDTDGNLIPEEKRGYYFPVSYIEPLDVLTHLLGFDLASKDERHQAVKLAFDQQKLIVTEKVFITIEENSFDGLLLILPIFDNNSSSITGEKIKKGVLVEAINLSNFINNALSTSDKEQFEIIITDYDGGEGRQVLYDSHASPFPKDDIDHLFQNPKEGDYWVQTIEFENRTFSIIVLPKKALLSFDLISVSWFGFLGSLILTFICCYYWLKRHHTTLEIVIRAKQYSTANRQLSQEIIERLKVEKRLIKFAHAFQLSADGINLLDMNGDYTYCNQASVALYGYNTTQMHDLHYYDINQDPAIKELDLLTQVSRQGTWHGEFDQTRKDGTKFPASISLSLIKDDTGSEIGILEITRDISETTQLEAELQQSRKMEALGTLAGGIAHDFNNILASILGNSEMIIMSKIEPIKTKSYIDNIQESCVRAADLVKQIMTFSRMETMQLHTIDLAKTINNALTIIRASLPANIHISSSINPYCASIKGDETQIHQIIFNLCSNASQAIGENGGTIAIDLHQEDTLSYDNQKVPKEQVRLSITDTGKGISAENVSKIFDPFFTTKKVGEGTGLGLAVVKSIIESHEGEISVKSVPEQGASFIITFPTCENAKAKPPVPEIEIEKKPESASKHVLIVEDEPHISKLYQEFINEFGYQTTVCEDGQQALAAFDDPNNSIDLVLTDQSMPKVTGKELSIILLNKQPTLPIIMCTGYSELINEDVAKDIGIKHYFLKPASLTKLMTVIDNLLKD